MANTGPRLSEETRGRESRAGTRGRRVPGSGSSANTQETAEPRAPKAESKEGESQLTKAGVRRTTDAVDKTLNSEHIGLYDSRQKTPRCSKTYEAPGSLTQTDATADDHREAF